MLKEIKTRNFIDSDKTSVDYLTSKFTRSDRANCLDYTPSQPIGFKLSETKKESIRFSIENLNIEFPEDLLDIINELEYSKYILDLGNENWDDDGALAIDKNLYLEVVKFVANYSNQIFSQGIMIDRPEINAIIDGSIDISWRAPKARLLINFKKDIGSTNTIAKFYGDLYETRTEKSGFINTANLDLTLVEWMKQLKK